MMDGLRSDHSFVVFIDESGDEGFVFRDDPDNPDDRGSSRWLVLSAVVFHAASELSEGKLIETAQRKLGSRSNKPLHYSKLSHDKQVAYAGIISGARMKLVTVLVHKPSLYAPSFSEKHVLYRYVSKFLLERVSWMCRDRFNDQSLSRCAGSGRAYVVFSNRRTMSYEDLRDYLRTLKRNGNGDSMIDWNVVDPEDVDSKPHEELRGLQFADVVASAYWNAVEPNKFGHTDDQSARLLRSKIYHWDDSNKRLCDGLKVWPSEAIPIFRDANDLLEY